MEMEPPHNWESADGALTRRRVVIRGAVQGVGFRPFVYRIATELSLRGWVNNSPQGVFLEVEGPSARVDAFLARLQSAPPPRAVVQSVFLETLAPAGFAGFEIRRSDVNGGKTALILPDLAMCPDCAREILDPTNRRYLYPFTNCTNCGPRFSIINALPYDRPNTTMAGFPMCPDCLAEYTDPLDRRFHAQPNACPACGPHVELWDSRGRVMALREEAIVHAARAIRQGKTVAMKGIGGFLLLADACDETAVRRLRRRKRRECKPFALLFPSLQCVKDECEVGEVEESLLTGPAAPIVLLRRRTALGTIISSEVAPQNPYLGAMLPYSPLHSLLMSELGFPVVATSGNLAEEPICTDEREALDRLSGIADVFLIHNRPILRHVDDSVVRVAAGEPMVLRRARGYAPLPVRTPELCAPALAMGAHLKNAIAVSVGHDVFISQHIGDLENCQALDAFNSVIHDFAELYDHKPAIIACDLHPDYASSQAAEARPEPKLAVQHHRAHILSCLADNGETGPALGVAWDGTGYGEDGSIWGGEFLRVEGVRCDRVAHIRPFRLPGGDAAVKDPRRSAFGLLYEMMGPAVAERDDLAPVRAMKAAERHTLASMLENGLNAPITTSMGRLFDAVSSLAGVRQEDQFEGQAAMELEYAMDGYAALEKGYAFGFKCDGPIILDWQPVIEAVIADVQRRQPAAAISARFHNGLVDAIAEVARRVGEPTVALSGGCFQNLYLLERTLRRLEADGFRPLRHRDVPPNDGGIALGQVMACALEGRGPTAR
ncbi:MAG TPA: carbamoyltransferase HypF [Armatimonadota bacterium]|jgi:hydrogenase maturation protein HypF